MRRPFPERRAVERQQRPGGAADGKPLPCQTVVRSRWGHGDHSSIRWLGVEFQAAQAASWWPERKAIQYYLEYGPEVKPAAVGAKLVVTQKPDGYHVDTGPLRFDLSSQAFNLLDNAQLDGKAVLGGASGARTVPDRPSRRRLPGGERQEREADHRGAGAIEGAVPRRGLVRERQIRRIRRIGRIGRIRWGEDELQFADRQALQVRLPRRGPTPDSPLFGSSTPGVVTFDPFTVRLKDVGLSLPLTGASEAVFGVEGAAAVTEPVSPDGVYLVQHLPHKFDIESGKGKVLATGKHAAGWASALTPTATVTACLRDAWQRYPKELEVKPANCSSMPGPPMAGAIRTSTRSTIHRYIKFSSPTKARS